MDVVGDGEWEKRGAVESGTDSDGEHVGQRIER